MFNQSRKALCGLALASFAFLLAHGLQAQSSKVIGHIALQVAAGKTVTLSFTPASDPTVTSYNIYRGTAAGFENINSAFLTVNQPAGTLPSKLSVNDVGPFTTGQTYFYIAKSFCSTCTTTKESNPSNEVSATPNTFPSGPPAGITLDVPVSH